MEEDSPAKERKALDLWIGNGLIYPIRLDIDGITVVRGKTHHEGTSPVSSYRGTRRKKRCLYSVVRRVSKRDARHGMRACDAIKCSPDGVTV